MNRGIRLPEIVVCAALCAIGAASCSTHKAAESVMPEPDMRLSVPEPASPPSPPKPVSKPMLVRGTLGVTQAAPSSPWDDPNKVSWVGHNTEAYDHLEENPFLDARANPLSTFSIDVDTASYANVRRFLNEGALPPPGAVRIEEMINYFIYDYAPPEDASVPFASHVEVAGCPWTPRHRLVRIGLKGREINAESRPKSNLVFLIDTSGSMTPPNKLPLLKRALALLVERMDERDNVAMVVYAGSAGLVLPSTPGDRKEEILGALEQLESGGSTNGGAGIQLAYDTAASHFINDGVNRVILATDGDFNVGTTNQSELVNIIEARAKSGVYLTVLGFGMGNLKDSTLEKLADKGNGNYAYIDSLGEARKVLIEQMTGSLITIAKDVKIQVEFNPSQVNAYRLIGYENRMLRSEDFNDDTKDAGEIGAGHTVTALYEVVPAGVEIELPQVDELKYQTPPEGAQGAESTDLLTLKIRYKEPDKDTSEKLEFPVHDTGALFAESSDDFRFAASVAAFGMLVRKSAHCGDVTCDSVTTWASPCADRDEYRREFLSLVAKAAELQ